MVASPQDVAEHGRLGAKKDATTNLRVAVVLWSAGRVESHIVHEVNVVDDARFAERDASRMIDGDCRQRGKNT